MLDKSHKETPSRRKGKEGKDESCYVVEIDSASGEPFRFWGVLELKVIPFFKHLEPRNVLLFSARFFGFGSDHLDLITLLR